MLNPEIYGTLTAKQARIIESRDIQQLVSFFEICHTVRESAHAMANAPEHRCVELDMIETLFVNHLELLRNILMEELEARKPKSVHELELRNECLCKWQMMCGDFTDAAKLLVDLLSHGRNLPARIA